MSAKPLLRHDPIKKALYRCWINMKQRCYNPSEADHPNYAGRGIKVCEEWKADFEAFKQWALDNGYRKGLTLDRENNNGDYSPSNCRWATRRTQNNNRRYTFNLTVDGETKPLTEWMKDERCRAPYNTVYSRLVREGWSAKRALFQPSRGMSI